MTERSLALARHFLEIDQPRRALDVLDEHELDLADSEYWGLRATSLTELGRFEDALAATERGLALEPESLALLVVNAFAHRRLGDLAAAERSLLAALSLDPGDATLLADYALLVAHAGQLDKARRLLDEAARHDPLDAYVDHVRGAVEYLAGDDKAAAKHAATVLAENPEERGALLLHAVALTERGSFRRAQRTFENAARVDPTDHDVARIARASRIATHPLLWPVLPFQRFGPGKVWLAYIALLAVAAGLGIGWFVIPLVLVYFAMVVYSWTVAPLVVRWLRRRAL